MKKLVPFLIAGALAIPTFSAVAMHARAQAGSSDCGDHGPRGEGGGRHHGGGRGHHGDPAAHAQHHARMLTAILDLDAHQQAEVIRLLTAEGTEMQTIMQQPRSDARHQAMQALRERTKESIDALLNPAQRATLDRMESARAADGRGRHGGPAAPATAPARPTR